MKLVGSLPFAAAILAVLLGVISLLRKKGSLATWTFFAGMVLLAVDSLLAYVSIRATDLADLLWSLKLDTIAQLLAAPAWLGFSLTYSRGNHRECLSRWGVPLAIFALLPAALSIVFQQYLMEVTRDGPSGEVLQLRLGSGGKLLNIALLVAFVLILMNLEQTFRSAVGTMRWRIKFVILGFGVIFGARIYVRTEALVFSAYDMHWPVIESTALLIGCVFLVLAYARTGFADVDVYPSRAVLRSSFTVMIAGGYLFIVGILANVVRRFGGAESFQVQAMVVLLGMAGLGLLLLSDRLRQRLHSFIGRHFARAQHDSVRIWTEFSRRLADVKEQAGLCAATSTLVSEVFEVLSVNIWLLEEATGQFVLGGSTAPRNGCGENAPARSSTIAAGLGMRWSPFDLEGIAEPWAEELRQLNPSTFPNGGRRWCVPLRTGEQTHGVVVLADRINGAEYTSEELQLLQCIADQVTSVLLNLRLANEVARGRELEAFRTMSAFFVHDLKNTAALLNLMLKNLPVHFDDPAFREDALRGIERMARRIDQTIARVTSLRQRPDFKLVEADLNELVMNVLERLDGMPQVELTKDLQPVPKMLADAEQIQSVVTNLVLNACDAVGTEGEIRIRTERVDDNVVFSVADNGCGMSAAFMKDSLFRPFQSTKKKGLGIGMFQSRVIVEAHGGSIRVDSETGKGSTFSVSLPVKA